MSPIAWNRAARGWRRGSRSSQCVVGGAGAALGSVARYLCALSAFALFGAGAIWGTLFANVAGSFLIGYYAALTGIDGRIQVTPAMRHFVMAGFCGGFTTFSIFSLETMRFAVAGEHAMAGLNVGGSLAAWMTAVWAGHAAATRLNRLGGR
jgi:fluoride exporter